MRLGSHDREQWDQSPTRSLSCLVRPAQGAGNTHQAGFRAPGTLGHNDSCCQLVAGVALCRKDVITSPPNRSLRTCAGSFLFLQLLIQLLPRHFNLPKDCVEGAKEKRLGMHSNRCFSSIWVLETKMASRFVRNRKARLQQGFYHILGVYFPASHTLCRHRNPRCGDEFC